MENGKKSNIFLAVTAGYTVFLTGLLLMPLNLGGLITPRGAKIAASLAHVTAYAILAFLLWKALGETRLSRRWLKPAAVAIAVLHGGVMEVFQALGPWRTGSFLDLCLNALGAVLVIFVVGRNKNK